MKRSEKHGFMQCSKMAFVRMIRFWQMARRGSIGRNSATLNVKSFVVSILLTFKRNNNRIKSNVWYLAQQTYLTRYLYT